MLPSIREHGARLTEGRTLGQPRGRRGAAHTVRSGIRRHDLTEENTTAAVENFQNTLKAFTFHSETTPDWTQVRIASGLFSQGNTALKTSTDWRPPPGTLGTAHVWVGACAGTRDRKARSPPDRQTLAHVSYRFKTQQKDRGQPTPCAPACGRGRQEGRVAAQTGQTLGRTHLGGTRTQRDPKGRSSHSRRRRSRIWDVRGLWNN